MLKLTYTENGFYLEQITQPLEEWVTTRVMLALRSGTTFWIEPGTAALLLPADLPYLDKLAQVAQVDGGASLDLSLGDADNLEVSLQGTWLATDAEQEEGIFVCSLSDRAEFFLYKLWQEAQLSAFAVND